MVACRRPRQGPCRGPDKGLVAAPAVVPGKALAGGLVVFLGWYLAKGRRHLSAYMILNVSSQRSAYHHGDVSRILAPWGQWTQGRFAPWVWGELPRQVS